MEEIKAQAIMDGIDLQKQGLLHGKLLVEGVVFPMLDNVAKQNLWLAGVMPFIKDVLKKLLEAELAKHP